MSEIESRYEVINDFDEVMKISKEIAPNGAHPFVFFEGFFEKGYISPQWSKLKPHLKERLEKEGIEKNKNIYPLLSKELGF